MATLKRGDVRLPGREIVPCPVLGGDVVVRGLLLSERLEDNEARKARIALEAAADGEPGEAAAVPQGAQSLRVLTTVQRCVVDESGESLLSLKEWDEIGGRDPDVVLGLFNKALALSSTSLVEVEKNS